MPPNDQDRYSGCKASVYKKTNGYVPVTKSTHPAYYFSQRLLQNLAISILCPLECIQPPTDLGSSLRLLQISYHPHILHRVIIFHPFHPCTRCSRHYQLILMF